MCDCLRRAYGSQRLGLAIVIGLVGGCKALVTNDGSDSADMDGTRLRATFSGLEPLGEDFVYEGWFIVDGAPVSTGRFTVDAEGQATPEEFEVDSTDADGATLFVLTIEPASDDDPGPTDTHVLAGEFEGDTAELSIGHEAALGNDFTAAVGAYVLNTPSSADVDADYDQGIWWLDPDAGPGASLELPILPAGWMYEGWVVGADGPISTGRFTMAAGADSDGAGSTAGADPAPGFPGQDFIDPPQVITNFAAVVSVEPEPDDGPGPFAIKPLVDETIEDLGVGVLQSMATVPANAPTGTATIVRN